MTVTERFEIAGAPAVEHGLTTRYPLHGTRKHFLRIVMCALGARAVHTNQWTGRLS
jgi:hypothetical protein